MSAINQNPLQVKIKSPMFGSSGVIEIECYVSKVSVEMLRNNPDQINKSEWVNLSFNIIQSKVVNGQ